MRYSAKPLQQFIPHTIRIRMPGARQVSIIGDFNNWHSNMDAMVEISPGLWERVIDLPVGEHRYAFFVLDTPSDAIRSRVVGQGSVLRVPEDPDQSFSIARTDYSQVALVA